MVSTTCSRKLLIGTIMNGRWKLVKCVATISKCRLLFIVLEKVKSTVKCTGTLAHCKRRKYRISGTSSMGRRQRIADDILSMKKPAPISDSKLLFDSLDPKFPGYTDEDKFKHSVTTTVERVGTHAFATHRERPPELDADDLMTYSVLGLRTEHRRHSMLESVTKVGMCTHRNTPKDNRRSGPLAIRTLSTCLRLCRVDMCH